MVKTINNVLFKRQGKIYIPKSSTVNTKVEDIHLLTLNEKLKVFGYTLSPELALHIKENVDYKDLENVANTIENTLSVNLEITDFKPMYKNFPTEVVNMEPLDLLVNQILHYWFGVLPESEEVEKDFVPLPEPTHILHLGTQKDIDTLIVQLLSSNVMLSNSDYEDLLILSDSISNKKLENLLKNTNVVIKELLIKYTIYCLNRDIIFGEYKTATDVLRLIAELSETELNSKHINFKKFTRPELRTLMRLLENCGYIIDDMNTYKKPWKKFFTLYASKINFKNFGSVFEAKEFLFGNKKDVETMGYKLNKAYHTLLDTQDSLTFEEIKEVVNVFKKRPGVFARQLISLLDKSHILYRKYIINQFTSVAEAVNNRVLLQLYTQVLNIDSNAHIVNTGKDVYYYEKEFTLTDEIKDYLLTSLENVIKLSLAKKDSLGVVYIDDSYKKIAITTSEKNAEEITAFPLTIGSRVKYTSKDVLRTFVSWHGYVDLDLSAIVYDEDFNVLAKVAYFNYYSTNKDNFIVHSGDITSAPNGAVEYVDINLKKVKEEYPTAKYILSTVNRFSGTLEDKCRVGVMSLTTEEATNKLNYSRCLEVGITSERLINHFVVYPLLIDIQNEEYIYLDATPYTHKNRYCSNVNDVSNMFIQMLHNKKHLSMYDLMKWNVEARGVLLTEYPEIITEDIKVYNEVSLDNPINIAEFVSEYI